MRAFVSYTSQDGAKAVDFVNILKENGIEVVQPYDSKVTSRALTKKSFFESINQEITKSDIVVIIYSKHYAASRAAMMQAEAIRLRSDIDKSTRLIVVSTDEYKIAPEFWAYQTVFGHKDIDGAKGYFSHLVGKIVDNDNDNDKSEPKQERREDRSNKTDDAIRRLKDAYREGNLSVVCGAGVSAQAGMPTWDILLNQLLNKMIQKLKGEAQSEPENLEQDLEAIKESSSLVVGRHLKDVLDSDFLPSVRDALYRDAKNSTKIVDAIVGLATPRRASPPLDSIITFNFDDLLETNLHNRDVSFQTIYAEGQRCGVDEIAVYHVHGYLPRDGKITKEMDIVFSEDAYHDQFIDPFSWSNLIQLSKYGQKTCLFVGLSLSDPNLRRLLDVSKRRDTSDGSRHFLIQAREGENSKSKLIESLRYKDAANLGLTTIWVDEYDDVPDLLRSIGQ